MSSLGIRSKLLLLIGGINTLLALVMYLLNSASFNRGFSDYLGQQVLAQQNAYVQHLEQQYQQQGSWQWLSEQQQAFFNRNKPQPLDKDQESWPHHHKDMMPPKNWDMPFSRVHSPDEPNHDLHLMVLDANKKPLFGFKALPPELITRPLIVNGQTVGYLGFLPRQDVSKAIDNTFQQQQQRMFAFIAIAMFMVSVLLAWMISQWLNHRVTALTQGTHALIAGDFQQRIDVKGHDEFAQLARDFNQLAQTLANNQQSRQQWIIDISHELRTPLAILQGELEALRDGIRPLSTVQIHSLWQEIMRLSGLVNDLHLLSQADAGSLSYHWRDVDIADIIDDVLIRLTHEFHQHQIAIDFQPISASIRGDSARLTQLWLNLAQNTLRYTDAGGQLRITMHLQQTRLVICWEDSSPSVPSADLPRLTERLFRVDDSRQRASGGSGLGLSIVQAIAQAHHAELNASLSELGGLCWTLSFERQT